MKAPLYPVLCTVTMALISIPAPSVAQQNTVEECQDEWRANRAENQAKGFKEQDYVAQCRDGFVPAPAVTLRWQAATPDTTEAVTGRSLRKRLRSAASATTRATRTVTNRSFKGTFSAAPAATLATTKAATRRPLRKRLHSAAPATTRRTKAVTGTPTGASKYEGSVDW
jgi:hypothetical protein